MPNTQANPSLGGLYAKIDSQEVVFPLKHTEVAAKISGNVSRVEVTQTFENPFTKPLEAIYIFPLPDEAAVDEMEIVIGDRRIKGNVKKREEAQEIYQQAKQEGRTAGLLEQQRDNIFTQSLANIKPRESIDVTIRYSDSLKFQGGDYEFVFPMVVGPRYIPGNPIDDSLDTDRVPDASKINPPILPWGMRSRHDINIYIDIDAGLPVSQVRSPSHSLKILNKIPENQVTENQVTETNSSLLCVQLADGDSIPNKDFILRYRVAGQETQSTILTQSDSRGGHFAVYLIPALEYSPEEIVAKDVVFLIDTSGSQMGDPLEKCQELMRRFINGLNLEDTFSIIDFSTTTRQLSSIPLSNTQENRDKAIKYINKLKADGGTELLKGINAVLNFPTISGRLRSIVLLTDGYIGNDKEILANVQRKLQPGNRLYSFGAGSSVNRYLLNRIAEIGRGTCHIIRHDEASDEVADKFFREINNPVLTNIDITWEGEGESPIIFPSIAPDLFAQQPLVLFGRKSDNLPGNIQIKGIAAGERTYNKAFSLNFTDNANSAIARSVRLIAQLWGRAKIKELTNQMLGYETKTGVEDITETALAYQLLSEYTAFVAVSEEVRVNPNGESITVEVPVEMPEGVQHQGIFDSHQTEELVRGITMPQGAFRSRMAKSVTSAPAPMMSMMSMMPLSAPSGGFAEEEEQKEELTELTIKIISAIALDQSLLDQSLIDDLTIHLQKLTLPSGFSGEMVFEFLVFSGRVAKIMFDEDASTLKDVDVIDIIKLGLATWRTSKYNKHSLRLILKINS
jgi:Ca-activated chloride channel homolog